MDINITVSGPIFQPGVSAKLQKAIDEGLNEIAMHGQSLVQRQLYAGHGVRTGHLRRSIWGGTTGPLRAQVDAGHHQQGGNVLYAKYVEHGTTRMKGYHMFQTAAAQLSQSAPLEKLRDRVMGALTT